MTQWIIMYIVLSLALIYAGYRIWLSLFRPRGGGVDCCAGCSGCALADLKKHKSLSQCCGNRRQNGEIPAKKTINERILRKNLVDKK